MRTRKSFNSSFKGSLSWVLTLAALLVFVDMVGGLIASIVINHQQMGKIIGAVITETGSGRVLDIVIYDVVAIFGILFVVNSLKSAHAIDVTKIRKGRMAALVVSTMLVVDVCVFMVEVMIDCTKDFTEMGVAIFKSPTNVVIMISIDVAIILAALLAKKVSQGQKGKRESSPKG